VIPKNDDDKENNNNGQEKKRKQSRYEFELLPSQNLDSVMMI
jgi:hypothetical protein